MSDRLMRQSLLGTSDKCLKQVEYALDPTIPYGTGEARVVGTAYHAGLEKYYSARLDGEVLQRKAVEDAAWVVFRSEIDRASDFRWDTCEPDAWKKVTDMLGEYLRVGVWPLDYQVLGTEVAFTEEWIPGWKAHGTIDLVLRGPDGIVVLDDHKSAGKKWRKGRDSARSNNQANWYDYWWWAKTGEMPRFCWSIMTYDGHFERRWAERNTSELLATMKKAESLAKLIDATGGVDLPPNTDGWWCSQKFCDHFSICPFGSAMDLDLWTPVEISRG